MSDELLISTSDIAELVDERLPVISTWRSRFKEGDNAFPAPVGGTPARPLFAFEAVRDWVSRNRPDKDLAERLLPVRVWSIIRGVSSAGIEPFRPVYWLHLVLASRKSELTPGSRLPVATPDSAAAGLPAEASAAIREIVASAVTDELIAISDFVLARLGAGYGRRGGEIGAVGSAISRILGFASLAQTTAGGELVVYDPSCGIGEALIQVATIRASEGPVRVLGTEINSEVAAIATVRLGLRGIPAQIVAADTLSTRQFEEVDIDVVVAEPPLGLSWAGLWASDDPRGRFGIPPIRNADLAWVVDAAVRLGARGRGLVLTSVSALSRGGAEERVRAELVRSGAVELVISLPPNLLQYSSAALALWVLRAPSDEGPFRQVHLIDASDPDVRDSGAAARSDWVQRKIASWIVAPNDVDPVDGIGSAVVDLDELLEAGMDLTPTRWIDAVGNTGVRDRLEEVSVWFSFELEQFHPEAPYFEALPSSSHVVTLREMTEVPESREAKLMTGRGPSNDDAPDDTITTRDIGAGVLRAVTEPGDGPGVRTEPGDIVFTTMQRVRAIVDFDGGRRLGNGVHVLRLEPDARFDPTYVATCLAARWNERHQKGSSIKHAKPGDLEIPLLTIDDQQRWLDALAELTKIRLGAEDIARAADELEIAAFNALRYGHKEDE